MGLSLSVPDGVKFPSSHLNMYKELHQDLGCSIPPKGNLERWAVQFLGIYLLKFKWLICIFTAFSCSTKNIGHDNISFAAFDRHVHWGHIRFNGPRDGVSDGIRKTGNEWELFKENIAEGIKEESVAAPSKTLMDFLQRPAAAKCLKTCSAASDGPLSSSSTAAIFSDHKQRIEFNRALALSKRNLKICSDKLSKSDSLGLLMFYY
ncbi:uracil dna glycosylase [Striga hermonthica]|uniref:Uracil dna glycosylase n=1 Tax=Striga hermonthica TaxID=68872 RepID=A0A9N7N431_STRHE|nr:uracil dna glycosylase [Striga hermonthica]